MILEHGAIGRLGGFHQLCVSVRSAN
jgi:hypothetical protein